jgi:hypothetical protein
MKTLIFKKFQGEFAHKFSQRALFNDTLCPYNELSEEPGYCTQGSNWLLAGQLRGWISSPCRVTNFLFSSSSRLALESTQPPIQWVLGALSPGVKWPRREADHSPPTRAEVKKMWIYTSTPPYAFMA